MNTRRFVAAMAALVLTSGLTVGFTDPALGQSPWRAPDPPIRIINLVSNLFTERVLDRLEKQQREAERLAFFAALVDRPPVWPVDGIVTSEYGWRWGAMHQGLDIAAPSGTPILAFRGGVVVSAGWDGGYGNKVVVDHEDGFRTVYAHNSTNLVAPGQTVTKGQAIALVGSTGFSTGPHVHFEVHSSGVAKNPREYL